jgi:hypothetical protein
LGVRLVPRNDANARIKTVRHEAVDRKSVFWVSKAFLSYTSLTLCSGAVLRVTKQTRKRNRLVVALLLPALVLVWLVGWSMYWLGHQREDKKRTEPAPEKDNVTLIPAVVLEEPQELEA